jgi:hypothetical protein
MKFEEWLGAMSLYELDSHIQEAEERLRFLKQARELRLRMVPPPASKLSAVPEPPKPRRTRKLSPQRVAIIDVMRHKPGGMSPKQIGDALEVHGKGMGGNALQTSLTRMVRQGLLTRPGPATYELAPHVASLKEDDADKGGQEP